MSAKHRSRRSFLVGSVAGVNAAWVAANFPAILAAQEHALKAGQKPRLTVFSEAQAAEIEAMAAQIIPTDATPGAREARCVYFIDRALATFAKNSIPVYMQGLADLQAKTEQAHPAAGKFSALTSPQQIAIMTGIEKTPFFNLVRTHTVVGFFARPEHGGNLDKAGWKLIGYNDSLNHKAPFGYYDAQPQPGRKA